MRMKPDADVTIVEKGSFLSYAGCGLPYYISGDLKEQKNLMEMLEDVANLDLSYASPHAPAMDNLIIAANVARNKRDGSMVGISAKDVRRKYSSRCTPVTFLARQYARSSHPLRE
jgi:hypothetical protein